MAPLGRGVAPDQAAEERRRELCDGGERQNADRGELRVAGRAIIKVGEHQDGEDRQPPHREQQGADVLAGRQQRFAPLQHPGDDDVVGDHDGERHRLHDHHGGRGGKAADERRNRQHVRPGMQRQRQHEHVAVDLAGREGEQAGDRDRHHEQVDQHQVDREHPARALDLALVVVLHHGDVELPRQQQDRDERQQRHRDQHVGRGLAGQHGGCRQRLRRQAEQRQRPVEHPEGDEDSDRQERHQLDDGLGRDGEHQAVLVLGRVDMPGPEQDGEHRHRHRDEQRHVAQQRASGLAGRHHMGDDGFKRERHRLELQRDVGNGADDRDQRDGGGDRLALAVARRDEVGDRRDVLALGEPHHARDQRREQPDHDHRADIDGEKLVAAA